MLQRLLELVLPRAWADDALGDLREDFLEWRRAWGPLRATLRVVAASLGLLAYAFLDHVRHVRWTIQEVPAVVRRSFRRPAIPLVAAMMLGPVLGLSGVFGSILFSALLGPLPHADADGLVVVAHEGEALQGARQSEALHRRYAAEVSSLRPLGLFEHQGATVLFPGGARRVPVVRATAGALRAVGADVEAGRLLDTDDDRASAAPVVMLTHEAWLARWGGDPNLVGRSVVVDGEAREIVGVLGPANRLPGPEPELVLSAALEREPTLATAFTWGASIGRLARGASRTTAQDEIEAAFRGVATEEPRLDAVSAPPGGVAPTVVSVRRWHAREVAPILVLGFGASMILLALTGAAVLTLLLSTAAESTRRADIRRALGATRSRLRAQATLDSLVALAGALAMGAVAAAASVRGLGTAIHVPVESWMDPRPAAAFALLCGLFLVPPMVAVRMGRRGPSHHPAPSRRQPNGGILLGAQAAACVLLLTALAASAGSLSTLTSRDLGFEAPDLLTFGVALPHRPYAEEAQRSLAFHEGVRRRLSALAEVDAVSYGVGVPVAHPGWAKPWETADRATTTDVPASHRYRTVARGYFGVLGIPILAGRPFSDAEISGEERAVVVNEALALHYWNSPDEALGRRLRPAGDTSAWARVVGVVGNTADQGAAAPSPAMIYEPASSVGDPRKLAFMQYLLRGASLGDHTIRSVRESLAEMDPQVPAYGFETVESFVRRDTARERMSVAFLGATALAGLLAVSMGLGGLVLVTIARRSREIGVRKALGASDARLRWRSLGPVWRPVVVGMAVGLALVAAGLRVPPALLHDAATWKGHAWTALLVLGPILTAAGYLGSRSVLRIDPAQAFREERW